MLIANLNILPSRIIWENEIQSIYPITLLSEKLLLASALSIEFIWYNDFEFMTDEKIIIQSLHFYRDQAGYIKFLEDIKDSLPKLKKLNNLKRKDKNALQLLGGHKVVMNQVKKNLKNCILQRMTTFNILELARFDKEGIWENNGILANRDENKEDGYIPVLTKIIPKHEYILCFNCIVEEIFTHNRLDSTENISFDYIKIPLWDLPMFDGITFLQMKYTLEELKPALVSFNNQLKEVTEKLFNIHFTSQNQPEIRRLCIDNITPLIPEVQQSINESLYLSQLKHKLKENSGLTFNLGITSAENLVNYYEKAEIILPYISTEIKDQLSRTIDQKASCLFLYVTVKTSDSV